MNQLKNKTIFLVINKFAGHTGAFENVIKKAIPYLKKKGFEVEYAFTNHPGHATELAAGAAGKGFGIVVAVGGDGTVNEVSQGLMGKNTPMGIIPMGSGNGLARELRISMNMLKSVQSLVNGELQQIDICYFKNQSFLCTSGIGFDAQVAEKMSKASTRGFLRYVQLTIQESLSFKPFKIKIKIDDKLIEKEVFIVTFANASQFGNNAYIAPSASLNDGLIDVVLVHPFNKLWLPVFGIGLFLKLLPKLPFVEYYKAKKIDLELAETSVFHFDGEPGKLDVPSEVNISTDKLWVIRGK